MTQPDSYPHVKIFLEIYIQENKTEYDSGRKQKNVYNETDSESGFGIFKRHQ